MGLFLTSTILFGWGPQPAAWSKLQRDCSSQEWREMGEEIGTNRQAIVFHALQDKKPHPWNGERGEQTLLG